MKLIDNRRSKAKASTQRSALIDNTPIMLAEIDTELRYQFANPSYAALFGKTPGDLIGQKLETIMSPLTFKAVKEKMVTSFKGEAIRYDLIIPDLEAEDNKKTRVLDVSYSPRLDENGNVKSFIAAIIDKTVERQALQEVESVNGKLRAAHDLSLNGFVVIRAIRNEADEIIDFAYIYANAKAEEIGQTKLVGHTLLELFPGNKDSGLYDAYAQVVATGTTYIKELYYEHDGLDFWLQISAIKLDDGCALSFEDISDRKNAETHNKLLLNELQHRVKNTLTTVQSMAAQTALNSKTIEEFSDKFQPRLRSISKAHDILLKSESVRASLETMINQQLQPYIEVDSGRLILDGTDILLSAASAHALGLILHELATNACKYGALSNDTGLVNITWQLKKEAVQIHWAETGGPTVKPPTSRGFGSLLIEESLKYGLGGQAGLDFDSKGLKVDIELPIN